MAMELTTSTIVCGRCGTGYNRRKGYFLVSYSPLYKGNGYMSVCKECVDSIFNGYLSECNGDTRKAVRQTCRKLDIYWNDYIFNGVEAKNTPRTIMTSYISRTNTSGYVGRCYDDTLREEETLWVWRKGDLKGFPPTNPFATKKDETHKDCEEEEYVVPDEVVTFWGRGYTPEMYKDLEQRREYWMSKFPDRDSLDVGTEALIRQICNLEIDITRDRVEGKSIDKSVNALNTLLGSASLKPAQKKAEDGDSALEKTPFGVWIKKWENLRPIPDPDPDFEDVDGIIRYISIWFRGHLAKMVGIKNGLSRMYEEAIAKLRVEHPEFEGDDDETLISDIFGESYSDGDE